MAGTTVLVVDDEVAFRDALNQALTKEGFDVHTASDGEEALMLYRTVNPDLILLDVMLPRMSGIDVCRTIRADALTPIIMVSARSDEIDAVVALEVGADDYITKPYRLRELVARMRTVLRRSGAGGAASSTAEADTDGRSDSDGDSDRDSYLEVGGIGLDRKRHEVHVGDELIELPLKEFQVLTELMRNAGYVVTRDDLIERVWGYDYFGDTKTLDVHIKRLRSRLEANPSKPQLIVTIRGLGYKMVP